MSGERFTLDTNILVYSIDRTAGAKQAMAQEAIRLAAVGRLPPDPASGVGVLRRRDPQGPSPGRRRGGLGAGLGWTCFPACRTPAPRHARRSTSPARSRRSYWDALLLCTAAEGGCGAILSEDMADGAVVAGVRIVNPFGADALTPAAMQVLAPAG